MTHASCTTWSYWNQLVCENVAIATDEQTIQGNNYASCSNNTAMHNICLLMLIFMSNIIAIYTVTIPSHAHTITLSFSSCLKCMSALSHLPWCSLLLTIKAAEFYQPFLMLKFQARLSIIAALDYCMPIEWITGLALKIIFMAYNLIPLPVQLV